MRLSAIAFGASIWITLAAADAVAGPSLGEVVASRCATCHATGAAPRGLEGRPRGDLAEALRGFRERSGTRDVMGARARLMTDAEIDAVAAYFAARRPVSQGGD